MIRMSSTSPEQPRPNVTGPVLASSEVFASAPALAKKFGSPIYEPVKWPRGSALPIYMLDQFPSRMNYRIQVIQEDGTPINIIGFLGKPSQRPGANGWERIPELESADGLAKLRGNGIDIVVRKDSQVVHLLGYQSASDAVEAALSLRVIGV